jgi:hypothetical protein
MPVRSSLGTSSGEGMICRDVAYLVDEEMAGGVERFER